MPPRALVLFGPPGIGKSTIVHELQEIHVKALDLEDVPQNERLNFLLTTDYLVYGAADLTKDAVPRDEYVRILLTLPSELAYRRRRLHRDRRWPEKARQRAQHLWQAVGYDQVIVADDAALHHIVQTLLCQVPEKVLLAEMDHDPRREGK